ncbi:MAG TPA: hypothetical protein ENN43_08490 [bacterium]|nr:hypothetical protein [bacterium]
MRKDKSKINVRNSVDRAMKEFCAKYGIDPDEFAEEAIMEKIYSGEALDDNCGFSEPESDKEVAEWDEERKRH